MTLCLVVVGLLAACQDPDPRPWAEAVRGVASLDPDDRQAAREVLLRRALTQREALKRVGKDDDDAQIALGMVGEAGARPMLLRLLKSEDAAVRAAAAEAMSWTAGDSGINELTARLEDPDLAVAMAAARALGRCKHKNAEGALRRLLGAKDERRALIAAHGLEVRDPGSMSSFIRQRLSHEIGFVVAANARSVAQALGRDFVTEETANGPSYPYKRDDRLKCEFEKGELDGIREDAMGTLLVRSGLLYPTDILAYIKTPGPRTKWAVARAPRLPSMRTSCLANELVKVVEDLSRKSARTRSADQVEAVEGLLQRYCGRQAGEELSERAAAYKEWWSRARVGMIDADVNRAIDDGVAWLKERQQTDGSWDYCQCGYIPHAKTEHTAGMTALSGYTLLKMEVPADDPSVRRAAEYLLDMPIEKIATAQTYSISLQSMFLGELLPKLKKADPRSKPDPTLAPRVQKRLQECVDWIVEARIDVGEGVYDRFAWTYSRPASAKSHDHSNSQFAVLGLLAGQNAGVRAPLKVWSGILNHWKHTQYEEGGWYYTPPGENQPKAGRVGSTSMTGAGLSSLLIGSASVRRTSTEKACETEEGAKRAIAKWEQRYPVPEVARYSGPGHVFSVYYDLYSIERAMMLGGAKTLGGRDWYHDGALYILWNQMHDGAWLDASDTCFALLFLKRAYIPVASGEPK